LAILGKIGAFLLILAKKEAFFIKNKRFGHKNREPTGSLFNIIVM
jgi:hypothetical protein